MPQQYMRYRVGDGVKRPFSAQAYEPRRNIYWIYEIRQYKDEEGVVELKKKLLATYDRCLNQSTKYEVRRRFMKTCTIEKVLTIFRGVLFYNCCGDTVKYLILQHIARQNNPEWVDAFRKEYYRRLFSKRNYSHRCNFIF